MFQSPHPPVEVGLLWVEMLRFYSLEFNLADNVISVRTSAVLSREIKDWPKKRIAVEGQKLSHLLYEFFCFWVLEKGSQAKYILLSLVSWLVLTSVVYQGLWTYANAQVETNEQQ